MKRVIFTLLHAHGSYMLSRNFRLQRIGDLDWLLRNYRLIEVSEGLDELMILNVAADAAVDDVLLSDVRTVARECFIPVTVGGGIRSVAAAERLLEVGVDKVLLNEPFLTDPDLCARIAARFGSQFLIQGIDVMSVAGQGSAVRRRMGVPSAEGVSRSLAIGASVGAGEVLVQSVDRDGTGMGLDLGWLDDLDQPPHVPLILMGGVGRGSHIAAGLADPRVDAVATANLLNFVGDSFLQARQDLLAAGIAIPRHPGGGLSGLRDIVRFVGAAERDTAPAGLQSSEDVDPTRGQPSA